MSTLSPLLEVMSPLCEVIKLGRNSAWKRNLFELDFCFEFKRLVAEMAKSENWRGLRDDLRNFLLSEQSYSMKTLAAKFEELRRHTNLSVEFVTP